MKYAFRSNVFFFISLNFVSHHFRCLAFVNVWNIPAWQRKKGWSRRMKKRRRISNQFRLWIKAFHTFPRYAIRYSAIIIEWSEIVRDSTRMIERPSSNNNNNSYYNLTWEIDSKVTINSKHSEFYLLTRRNLREFVGLENYVSSQTFFLRARYLTIAKQSMKSRDFSLFTTFSFQEISITHT